MNDSKNITREYKISDDSMLMESSVTTHLFEKYQSNFVVFDSAFDNPFLANWKAAIITAQNTSPDYYVLSFQVEMTDQMEQAMEVCRNCFQSAKYLIEKAFPNNKSVWNEFGYESYDESRLMPLKMYLFMCVFWKVADLYKDELIAVNFTQANIDAIKTNAQTLLDLKIAQQMAKNSRYGITQTRIKELNTVWNFRTMVARAAKNIFANNPPVYALFLLPATEEAHHVFSILGWVTEQTTLKVLPNVTVLYIEENGNTITDSKGKYGIPNLKKGTYTLNFILKGYKTNTQVVDFKGTKITLSVEMEKEMEEEVIKN